MHGRRGGARNSRLCRSERILIQHWLPNPYMGMNPQLTRHIKHQEQCLSQARAGFPILQISWVQERYKIHSVSVFKVAGKASTNLDIEIHDNDMPLLECLSYTTLGS